MGADASRVSTFVFQFCFISGRTLVIWLFAYHQLLVINLSLVSRGGHSNYSPTSASRTVSGNMKKAQIFIVLFLFYAVHVKAEYSPLKLYFMILDADKIIDGTIKKLDKTFFYIDDTSQHQTIKIKRFQDWACASRFDKYKVGQRVILFLKKEKGHFYIMSGGGEGEVPIINDSVIFRLFPAFPTPHQRKNEEPWYNRDSLAKYKFLIGDDYYHMKFKVSISDLKSAIEKLKNHFVFHKPFQFSCGDFSEKKQDGLDTDFEEGSFSELIYRGIIQERKKYCH
jgi:hypothetical protein